MKLMTKMERRAGGNGYMPWCDPNRPVFERYNHDAAAAHALMQAIDRVSSQVTFHTMTNRECVAQLLDAVRGTADEIMAGWGFDSGEVEGEK